MQLKPGLRLKSAVCAGEFIVVRAPKDAVDLRCGGHPVGTADAGGDKLSALPGADGGAPMGKRYADDGVGLELLVTKAATGALAIGDTLLEQKGAKALPASD